MGSSSFCRKTNIYIAKCLLFLILQPVSKMPLSHWDSQKGPISKIPKDLWVNSPVNYRTFSVLKRVYELKHFLFHSTSTYLFKGVPIHCPVRILNIFFFSWERGGLWFVLSFVWKKEWRELLSTYPGLQNFKFRKDSKRIHPERKKKQYLLLWILVIYSTRVW